MSKSRAPQFLFSPPKGARRSFRFLKQTWTAEGARRYETVQDSRIDALNAAYGASPDTLNDCVRQAEALRATLKKELRQDSGRGDPVFLADNLKLLDRFWKAYLPTRRRHVDPSTAFYEYRRAVEALGELPLLTAPVQDIQREVNRKLRGRAQRRVVKRLRTILRHFRREQDARLLILDHEEDVPVKHLTREEYGEVRAKLPNWRDRVVADCLAYTGMRVGELFASRPEDLKGEVLLVREQMSRKKEKKQTKNRKTRKTLVIGDGLASLKEWWAIEPAKRAEVRNRQWSDVVKTACRKAFPGQSERHLCAHDLRHCYSIWLLNAEVSLHTVARCIGDNLSVAEKHYVGFIASDEALATAARKVAAKGSSEA